MSHFILSIISTHAKHGLLLDKHNLTSSSSEKPGKPDAPEILQVNKNSVALKWKPPKSDGGAEITNYVVEYRIEGSFFCNFKNMS